MAQPALARGQEPRSPAGFVVWTVFAVAAIVSASLLLHVGRGLSWYFDEWNWILERRDGSLDGLLRSHNGHLIAVPLLVYRAVWAASGLHGYTTMRVITVGCHVAVAAVLLVWLRRRLRDELACLFAVVVLFLGIAWQDLLWPSQLQYFASMLGGIAALVALDRRDRVGDVLACVALTVSIASSGLGLPFIGAVALVLALRRATWRRLWVPLVPLAAYGAWYLGYGDSQAQRENVHLVPGYVERAGASAAGALLGRGIDVGQVVLAAIALLVVVAVARRRRISPELAGCLALPLLFWGLTALSRAQADEPGASRYLYPGAVFLVLVIGQAVDDPEWPAAVGARVAVAVAALALAAVSIVGNVAELRTGAAGLRTASTYLRAELTAVELARATVDPAFGPDPVRAPQITAGPYLAAVDALGSPADSVRALRRRPAEVRAAADRVLLDALGSALAPAAGDPGACTEVVPTDGRAVLEVTDPAPDVTVTATGGSGVDVAARNLAADFTGGALGAVAPGDSRRLALPAVASGPWTVALSSAAGFRVCRPT